MVDVSIYLKVWYTNIFKNSPWSAMVFNVKFYMHDAYNTNFNTKGIL